MLYLLTSRTHAKLGAAALVTTFCGANPNRGLIAPVRGSQADTSGALVTAAQG